MAIGSILLGLALFVLVGLFVARPFLRPEDEEAVLAPQQQLLVEKEALLDQIQALDFDHDTGKIPTELHAHQRAKLMEQAPAVLQALDGTGDEAIPGIASDEAADRDIEMEAAIARLRRQRSNASAATPGVAQGNGHARFCPQCGESTDLGDRFCAHCGHSLALATPTKTA